MMKANRKKTLKIYSYSAVQRAVDFYNFIEIHIITNLKVTFRLTITPSNFIWNKAVVEDRYTVYISLWNIRLCNRNLFTRNFRKCRV